METQKCGRRHLNNLLCTGVIKQIVSPDGLKINLLNEKALGTLHNCFVSYLLDINCVWSRLPFPQFYRSRCIFCIFEHSKLILNTSLELINDHWIVSMKNKHKKKKNLWYMKRRPSTSVVTQIFMITVTNSPVTTSPTLPGPWRKCIIKYF